MINGVVFDIRRFSIHDGPGIRTAVFLKGCPLRCVWCHNPEGINKEIRLWHFANKCISCGKCIASCPKKALRFAKEQKAMRIDYSLCDNCGICVAECPTGALAFDGELLTTDEVFDEIMKDIEFYRVSGGGVTLTGGEPLRQHEFCMELLGKCKSGGINTAIETCLYVRRDVLEGVIPLIDYFMVDIKLFEEEEHKKHTGVENETIKENFKYLAGRAKNILVRVPLIPGYTDGRGNLEKIARFVAGVRSDIPIELMNYNPLAPDKYRIMHKKYKPGNIKPFSDDEMKKFYEIIRQQGGNCK